MEDDSLDKPSSRCRHREDWISLDNTKGFDIDTGLIWIEIIDNFGEQLDDIGISYHINWDIYPDSYGHGFEMGNG